VIPVTLEHVFLRHPAAMPDTDVHALPTVEAVVNPRPARPLPPPVEEPPGPARPAIPVNLGEIGADSITPAIAALVERGVLLRPDQAMRIRCGAVIRFTDGHPSVRMDFRGNEIVVSDVRADDRAHDLLIEASLPDLVATVGAPLAGGLPKPTTSAGRAAIARLADGRVDFDGSLRRARQIIKLLALV
jgi:hypothetical protein